MKSLLGITLHLLLTLILVGISFFRSEASLGILPSDTATKNIKTVSQFSASLKNAQGRPLSFNQKKLLLKKQLRSIKQSVELNKKQKVLLTILTIAVFLGLVAIWAIITYNGMAGLWPLVGLGVSIYLLVFFLKRIWRKNK